MDGAVDLFLFHPLLAGNRAVPVPVLVTVVVLVDVAVIKLVAALNPCKAEGYRSVGWGRSLFTFGVVDVDVDVDVDAGRLQQPVPARNPDRRVSGTASGISWVTDWPGRCTMNPSDTTWA